MTQQVNTKKRPTREDLDASIAGIVKLNTEYSQGRTGLSQKAYLAKYNYLVKLHKALVRRSKGIISLTEQMAEVGVKVTKKYAGVYIYHGINFTCEISEEKCETVWWEVNIYEHNIDPRVEAEFEEYNNFYTKKSLLGTLFQFDNSLNK